MRCANCLREERSVKLRDLPIGMFRCDICTEYEEASLEFRLNTDSAESARLYDRIFEIAGRIEKLVKEPRKQTADR